jgi:hypothetical protein
MSERSLRAEARNARRETEESTPILKVNASPQEAGSVADSANGMADMLRELRALRNQLTQVVGINEELRKRLDMVQGGPSSMYSRIQLRPTTGSTRPPSEAESNDGRVSPTGYTQQPPRLHYSRDWKLPKRKFDGKEVRKGLGANVNRYILTLQEDTATQSRKTGEVWTEEGRKDLFVRGLEDVALAFYQDAVLPLIQDREVGYEELCQLFRDRFQSKLHDDRLYKLMNVPKKREETFIEYLTYLRDVERNTSRDDGDMLLQCFSQGASKEFKSLLLMEAENCRKRGMAPRIAVTQCMIWLFDLLVTVESGHPKRQLLTW